MSSGIPSPTLSKRHGSQRRQRVKHIAVYATEAEDTEITAKAQTVGLSASGFLRSLGLAVKLPPPRRLAQASVSEDVIAKLIAELRRAGNNLNQIAREMNSGRAADLSSAAVEAALREHVAVLQLVRAAIGGRAA